MDKEKVLVVTYYWPPSGGPGVQRWLKFVKYFEQFGIEPVVVTVKEEKASYPVLDPSLEKEVPSHVKVHKTSSFEPLRIFSSVFKKEKVPYAGIPDRDKMSLAGKISLYIRANYFIPDARKGWNKHAFKKCCEIIEKENIKRVITTSPPHSTQLIGLELKKKYGIQWLADLRDPWTDIYYYSKFHHTEKAKRKDLRYEKQVLENADVITVTSEQTKRLFSRKIQNDDKIKVVTNGYDESDLVTGSVAQKNKNFTIGFSGTVNKTFGIEPFIEVIKNLIQQGKNIQLQFVGNVEPALQNETSAKLKNNINFTGYVSHKQAIAYSAAADMLLLIVPPGNNQGTVPGKTFEYLSTQNPVLCLTPPNGSAAEIIEKCQAGKGIGHENKEEMTSFILALYEKWQRNESIKINNVNFKNYSRKELTKSMAGIIKEMK